MKEKVFFENSTGVKLCGILSGKTPDPAVPAVLMCHGFTTSKDGRTYVGLEERLNAGGLAVFRFDFFGHGESEGRFEDITISEAVDDVLSAHRFLGQKGSGRIGLFGSSFGGMAAIIAAAELPHLVFLALKSPVSDYLGLLIARDHGREIQDWKKEGSIEVTASDGGTLRLNYGFFEDARRIEGYALALKIKAPTLIVHGDRDETVPLEQSLKLQKAIPGSRLEVISGADHVYSRPADFERLLDLITGFVFKTVNQI